MTKAYIIHHISDKKPPGWDDEGYRDDFWWLERVSDGTCIYMDGGEPEDRILVRNLEDLVDELNAISSKDVK